MKHGLETYLHTLESAWRFKILYGKEKENKLQDILCQKVWIQIIWTSFKASPFTTKSLKRPSTSPWSCITTAIDAVAHLLWILLLKDAIVSAWKKNANCNQAYPKWVPQLRLSTTRKDQDLPFQILPLFRERNSQFSSDSLLWTCLCENW
jgi:hypothetical protein